MRARVSRGVRDFAAGASLRDILVSASLGGLLLSFGKTENTDCANCVRWLHDLSSFCSVDLSSFASIESGRTNELGQKSWTTKTASWLSKTRTVERASLTSRPLRSGRRARRGNQSTSRQTCRGFSLRVYSGGVR